MSKNFAFSRLKKYVFGFIVISLFSLSNAFASVSIDGYAYLENQTVHDSIEVFFEMVAPNDSTYTMYTNGTGYYTQEIMQGVYDITYSKTNYYTKFIFGQSLYVNATLDDVNLFEHTTLIHVPGSVDKIQEAIDQAFDGDTILVDPGVYVENINFLGKGITVGSLYLTTQDTMYILQTIIDGGHDINVVRFIHGEESTSILTGFTIQNGYAHGNYPHNRGGGILCNNSSPLLMDLIITNNSSNNFGGGMCCYENSNPRIENVIIKNNIAENGGGISLSQSEPIFKHVVIINNTATYSGGGVYCSASDPFLFQVTISNNSSDDNGSGIHSYCSDPIILNCIVSQNDGGYGFYNHDYNPGNPSITCSNFYDNGIGNFYNCYEWLGVNVTTNLNGDSCDAFYNIQLNPLFVDSANNDYHLSWANYPIHDETMSPCIDAGDPDSPLDPDGTIADIGAYYFNQNVSIDEQEDNSQNTIWNYPNPSKNSTQIHYSLKQNSLVKINIYNIKGQLVSTLVNEDKPKGEHSVIYDTEKLNSGVYFYKIEAGGVSEINKLVVIK